MIWLASRGFERGRSPVVAIAHQRWYMAHWRTGHGGKRWNYVQFRLIGSPAGVRDLSIRPLVAVAERHGFVRPHWWLTSVEAGFEIWCGGVGLRTTSFRVHL